jgi:hypothetical protein
MEVRRGGIMNEVREAQLKKQEFPISFISS